MELLLYVAPTLLGIALWIGISEFLEKALQEKKDEVSRIKRSARRPHFHEDKYVPYWSSKGSTVSFWKKDEIDSETEERMRYRIRKMYQ